jgi:hypothetical protein
LIGLNPRVQFRQDSMNSFCAGKKIRYFFGLRSFFVSKVQRMQPKIVVETEIGFLHQLVGEIDLWRRSEKKFFFLVSKLKHLLFSVLIHFDFF